jgi:hypothetical protein
MSFRVHSGLSASGREGLGFRVLLIYFLLFAVSFPGADNAKFVFSWGDNDGVKTSVQERENPQAHFTVVAAGILHNECGFPIEFGGERKGQAALGYFLVVLGRVEGKAHPIYCYSNNRILQGLTRGILGVRFKVRDARQSEPDI